MTPSDFRRLALALPGATAGAHMGAEDFRVDGGIFATLAHAGQGYGNLMLTSEQQAAFTAEAPEVFVPVPGGWGRRGATHIRLSAADEPTLEGALRVAWKLRVEKNAKLPRRTSSKSASVEPGTHTGRMLRGSTLEGGNCLK